MAQSHAHEWTSPAARARIRNRHGKDRRLQYFGIAAIGFALALLMILIASLTYTGYVAFYTTKVALTVTFDAEQIDIADPGKANYRTLTRDALFALFPAVSGRKDRRELLKIISSGAPFIVRDYIVDNPQHIGGQATLWVPLSDPFDQMYKGIVPRRINALSSAQTSRFEDLNARGFVARAGNRAAILVDIEFDPASFAASDSQNDSMQKDAVHTALLAGFSRLLPDTHSGALTRMLASDAEENIAAALAANSSWIGTTQSLQVPLAAAYDVLHKTGESKILNPRFSSVQSLAWFDTLAARGLLSSPFSTELFVNSDSRFPELAGLAGALSGSFLALLVCFVVSFPIGISAAIYLEEFAPRNRFTDAIEVNINNLAAVPSVVFGLLGLAVFINFFGLPRSAPIVGGLVLALMTLPTIIVATRSALKAVPPSIREAALGIGASKHEMIMHHVIPLAMPGILTGTIIGLAQALGETAPLLLIGMNAFIPSIENIGLFQPATSLPTQIFAWGDSPERGFVSRTSAAILVLLGFLITMNIVAIYLRQKFERMR